MPDHPGGRQLTLPANGMSRGCRRIRTPTYHRGMLLVVDIGNTNITLGVVEGGALVATRRAGTPPGDHGGRGGAPPGGPPRPRWPGARRRDRASPWPRSCPSQTAIVERDRGRSRRSPCWSPPRALSRSRSASIARARWARTGWSTPWPPSACTARRRSSWTSAPPRRSTASAPTAPTSAAPSPPASSSASRRSRHATAKLPRIELRTPDRAIGRDTVSAMQSGTIFGYQALATGLLARVRARARRAGGRRAGGRPHDPDRRPVGRTLGAGRRGRGRHRPGPDAQGPRHPPRRGRRRGAGWSSASP